MMTNGNTTTIGWCAARRPSARESPRAMLHALGSLHVLALLTVLLPASCSAPSRMPAVPREIQDRATVLGNPALRSWDDTLDQAFLDELILAGARETDARRASGDTGPLPTAYYLAISGGGADGAFGAGLLCGWTAEGSRPEFKVVTGISTGALTAPFAFLGPRYDDELRELYTTISTKDIATPRGILAVFFNDALADNAPLRRLMEEHINEEMMRDIAAENARGRLLFIGTTNLDANRGVVWNIGAIASSGDPDALRLIQDILIASAAIPAAFPPVMFDVEADGTRYQEMHVDGGTRAQVFLYPPSLNLRAFAAEAGISRERVAFIILNARLDPGWDAIERRTLSIASRAIGSLIQTQGIGDLYRLYLVTRRDDVDFNLAFIPASFTEKPQEAFDPVFMSALFEAGYRAALQPGGYPWNKEPPGYSTDGIEKQR